MRTYKLRAECLLDVEKLMHLLFKRKCVLGQFIITPTYIEDIRLPDVELEFSTSLDLKTLHEMAGKITDGHVMLETLELKENYTGARREREIAC